MPGWSPDLVFEWEDAFLDELDWYYMVYLMIHELVSPDLYPQLLLLKSVQLPSDVFVHRLCDHFPYHLCFQQFS